MPVVRFEVRCRISQLCSSGLAFRMGSHADIMPPGRTVDLLPVRLRVVPEMCGAYGGLGVDWSAQCRVRYTLQFVGCCLSSRMSDGFSAASFRGIPAHRPLHVGLRLVTSTTVGKGNCALPLLHVCRSRVSVGRHLYRPVPLVSLHNRPLHSREIIKIEAHPEGQTRGLHGTRLIDLSADSIEIKQPPMMMSGKKIGHVFWRKPAVLRTMRQNQYDGREPVTAEVRRLPGGVGSSVGSPLGYRPPPFGTAGISLSIDTSEHERIRIFVSDGCGQRPRHVQRR